MIINAQLKLCMGLLKLPTIPSIFEERSYTSVHVYNYGWLGGHGIKLKKALMHIEVLI